MENIKLKRGLIWTGITAGLLVAIIVFNVLFSLLAGKFLWVIDTSPYDLIQISDYSRGLLEKVDPNENEITIYFLADPDELANYELTGHEIGEKNTWGMSYIYNLAKLYEREYPFVTVDLLDTAVDADFIRENFAMTVGTNLSSLTVVLENKSELGKTYRTLERDNFYIVSGSSVFFRGDDRFTSTILSLSGEKPLAYFTEGHGEKVGPKGDHNDFGEAAALANLFREAGYEVRKISLAEGDFPKATDDMIAGGAATVVIYGPTTDFTVEDSANEITRLRKYVNLKNHNLMVFMDPGVDEMPNLEEYLEDYWGVDFEDNILVADTSDSEKSPAISDDGKFFYGAYDLDTTSPGSGLTSSLKALDSLPGAYFGPTRTIKMKKSWSSNQETSLVQEGSTIYKLGPTFRAPALSAAIYNNDGGYLCFDQNLYEREYYAKYYEAKRQTVYDDYYARYYQKEYDSYYENAIKDLSDAELTDAKLQEIKDKSAEAALAYVNEEVNLFMNKYLSVNDSEPSAIMTLTHGSWMYTQSENVNTYLLACGSTEYASVDAIGNRAFSNRDVLYSAIYLFGKNVLPYDIDIIRIDSPSALLIKDTPATVWTVILAGVIPVLFVGAGIYVAYKRRRHN